MLKFITAQADQATIHRETDAHSHNDTRGRWAAGSEGWSARIVGYDSFRAKPTARSAPPGRRVAGPDVMMGKSRSFPRVRVGVLLLALLFAAISTEASVHAASEAIAGVQSPAGSVNRSPSNVNTEAEVDFDQGAFRGGRRRLLASSTLCADSEHVQAGTCVSCPMDSGGIDRENNVAGDVSSCLLYTSPSPRD